MSRRAYEAAMLIFYLGVIVVGAVGFTPDAVSPGVVNAFGDDGAMWLFSAQLVVFGIAALLARLVDHRGIEFYALIGIGVATAIHGLILIDSGGEQTGIRLLIAPGPLIAYAMVRRGRGDDAVWDAMRRVRADERGRR